MTDLQREVFDRLAPISLQAEMNRLSEGVRESLPFLAQALSGIDVLFRRQLGDHVVQLAEQFTQNDEWNSLNGRAFRYFNGPYNHLAGGKPFIENVPPLKAGKALYPSDLTEAELDTYLEVHPDKRAELLSPYTVVKRQGEDLIAVAYHEHFASDLKPVVAALLEAAEKIDHAGLQQFVRNRAKALAGDYDLLESDADWVRLTDTPLELVIGPFEVYEDGLKGVKAFYEAMLLMVDVKACEALAQIEKSLPELHNSFPCPGGARPAVGGMAPMIVADELLTAGEGRSSIMAAAFNLPNDAGVRGRVGWKQIMIRNVMQAKFNACTRPIAQRVLSAQDVQYASFESFFFHVLLHEISHGLGPAYRADGRGVNEACGKHYTPLEEAKADTGALYLLLKHSGKFGLPDFDTRTIGVSYFAGLHRSVRFGLHEAHGKANVIQYAYLREKGAFVEKGDGLGVSPERLLGATEQLLQELTLLQATGSDQQLADFLERYGRPPVELENSIARLADLPIDILPTFPLKPVS